MPEMRQVQPNRLPSFPRHPSFSRKQIEVGHPEHESALLSLPFKLVAQEPDGSGGLVSRQIPGQVETSSGQAWNVQIHTDGTRGNGQRLRGAVEMRKIIEIIGTENWTKDNQIHRRTYALLDDGTEATGYGDHFAVGDEVMVFYHHETVKMSK